MTRVRKPRWRCAFCAAFGYADTEQAAVDDFEKHYQSTHMTKESK